MASRAQSITIGYLAWDTANAVGKTGDVANHTLRVVKDGGSPAAPTNSAAEIDSTNMPGWYKLVLTSTETTADVVILGGKSSSSGIVICGTLVTLENLPTPAPGAANGVFIAGTNAATVITTSLTTHLVGTVDTVTTYTGNTPQTGDAYARIGLAGVGLTGLGDTRIANLDAAVSTRSTYAGGAVASVTGNVGGNVTGSVGSVVGAVGSVAGSVGSVTGLTTAAIATAVWQDTTAGDFTVVSSIGKSLYTSGAVPGASGGHFIAGTNAATTVSITGSLSGSVGSVTAAVTLDKTQTLSAARNISAVADTSLTLNDALHCAIAAAAGQETVVSTAYTVKTPSTGTTLRIFTLDSATAPTSRT